MEAILRGLTDLSGVTATLVFDGAGKLLAHRGHAVYDRALCEQVSASLAKAIDSIQLQQEDWEMATAHFADGRLLLRNLGAAAGQSYALAVVGDGTLNPQFATVVIRVAAGKLRRAIEGGPGSGVAAASSQVGAGSTVPPPASAPPTPPPPGAGDSRAVLSATGQSWSKGSSSILPGVASADPAAAAFLGRCAKLLARQVGPMARVYVEEAVRRISPDAPFTLAASARLVEELALQIEDEADQVEFRRAIEKV